MIVPFAKGPQPQSQGPSLNDLPEAILLAAMGKAHADGKFHVYDQNSFDVAKRSQQKFDKGVGKQMPDTKTEQEYYDDQQTDRDRLREMKDRATTNKESLEAIGKKIEKEQQDPAMRGLEDEYELRDRRRKGSDI
jgi:hypothetical protein